MSISTIEVVLGRIESAEPHSPIAVFKAPDNKLRAVFYTEKTKEEMRTMASEFIGLFDSTMDVKAVYKELSEAL